MSADPHEAYLATMPPGTRTRLKAIRAEVERRLPGAKRDIAYQMPALRTGSGKNRVFFYFAGFRKHIGIYPPVHDAALLAELTPWRGPKDNLILPLNDPLPLDLVGRLAEALARQYQALT